jgi:hypothetical protein
MVRAVDGAECMMLGESPTVILLVIGGGGNCCWDCEPYRGDSGAPSRTAGDGRRCGRRARSC